MYFYDLGSGTFVGMSLTLQLEFKTNPALIEKPGMSAALRFYCYLNGVQLFPWPVCDCVITHPAAGGGPFSLSAEEKVLQDKFINTTRIICPLALLHTSLQANGILRDQNGKHSSVKRLTVQKAYFYLCHATQVTSNRFCSPSPLPVENGRIWSPSHCYACQLVMEILIATIKYFSKACPQIHYHSCWRDSCEREGAINLVVEL